MFVSRFVHACVREAGRVGLRARDSVCVCDKQRGSKEEWWGEMVSEESERQSDRQADRQADRRSHPSCIHEHDAVGGRNVEAEAAGLGRNEHDMLGRPGVE